MSSVRQAVTGQHTIGKTNVAPAGGCLPGWMQECMDAHSGFFPPAPKPAKPEPPAARNLVRGDSTTRQH
jgi:hypothetical protein